ncbi:MAG TPA: hypothetical protein DCQ83_07865 [Fibrobacteres bacterium]|nr:hypothetical protein [Fibrobacterota bacterium]
MIGTLLTSLAWSDVHHFGYITETGTLPAGATEVEIWNTARIGKDAYYYGLDQRLEFETGLTDHLQASLYLNWMRTTEAAGTSDTLRSTSAFKGLSAELKYKISDPSADALGFGLYGELGFNTDATELEGKALLDKNVGSWILAANLIVEAEIENRSLETEEIEISPVIGAAYEISPRISAGLELRNHNEFEKEGGESFEWMNSAVYLGPSLAYTTKAMTVTFTLLPQLPALKTEDGTTFELHDHEKVEARLHLSLHF